MNRGAHTCPSLDELARDPRRAAELGPSNELGSSFNARQSWPRLAQVPAPQQAEDLLNRSKSQDACTWVEAPSTRCCVTVGPVREKEDGAAS